MWVLINSNDFKIYDISFSQYSHSDDTIKWIEWPDSPEDFIKENIKLWRYTPEGIFVKNTDLSVIESITPIQESTKYYALVSPSNNSIITQIETEPFPLLAPLFWIVCPDTCKVGMYYNSNGTFTDTPQSGPPAYQNKITAISLLQSTDWATFSDVVNKSETPHLINQDAFIEYRRLVRIISLNPPDGNVDWPIRPIEVWSE